MIAYLVWGTNGQDWSSKSEWEVAVYYDKGAAETHAEMANDWKKCLRDEAGELIEEDGELVEMYANPKSMTGRSARYTPNPKLINPFDPNHTKGIDPYSLTEYKWAVKPIMVLRHLDEFLEQPQEVFDAVRKKETN